MPGLGLAIRDLIHRLVPQQQPGVTRATVQQVLPDGTHLLSTGAVAPVSGHHEFKAGEIVDVIQHGQDPLILGHTWAKGDVPTVFPRGVEEVEEIVTTSGIHTWLRSWRGLFYLDIRDVAAASVPPDSRAYMGASTLAGGRFGQRDNQFACISAFSVALDFVPIIYLFEIDRALHSDITPESSTKTLNGVEFPSLSIRLVAYYDLKELNLDAGVAVTSTITLPLTQRVCIADIQEFPFPTPAIFSLSTEVIQHEVHTDVQSYSVVIDPDAYFFKWSGAGAPPPQPSPYVIALQQWWVDGDGSPVLVFSLQNTHAYQTPPMTVLRRTGTEPNQTLTPTAKTFRNPASFLQSLQFEEEPLFVIRFDTPSSEGGGLSSSLLGKSCEDSITLKYSTEDLPLDGFHGFSLLPGDVWGNFYDLWVRYTLSGATVWNPAPSAFVPVFSGNMIVWPYVGYSSTTFTFTQRNPTVGADYPLEHTIRNLYVKIGTSKAPLVSALFYPTVYQDSDNSQLFQIDAYSRGSTVRFHVALDVRTSPVRVVAGRSRIGASDEIDILLRGNYVSPLIDFGSITTGLWRIAESGDSFVQYRRAIAAFGTEEWSGMDIDSANDSGASSQQRVSAINRDYALVERPSSYPRELIALDGSINYGLPDDLSLIEDPYGNEAAKVDLLAPDRLYDNREDVLRFRSPENPQSVSAKPKPLVALAKFPSDPTGGFYQGRFFHTVGKRSAKPG